MNREHALALCPVAAYTLFVAVSFAADFAPGKQLCQNLLVFLKEMLSILPCVFVLIGLFEVWVKKETIVKHLGHGSGAVSYVWSILLAGTTVGGLYVALPVAHALHLKGARPGVVMAYLGASAICRVPMSLFEASFLGWKFTTIRFLVSLPLVVLTSIALGTYLERRHYQMPSI